MPNKEASMPARAMRLGRGVILSGTLAASGIVGENLAHTPSVAKADSTPVVEIFAPLEGDVMTGMGAMVGWRTSNETNQLHVQLVPANNDGPGINRILSSQEIIKGKNWGISRPTANRETVNSCLILPKMGYTWRLRAATSELQLQAEDNTGWGPWAERHFRSPARGPYSISPESPQSGNAVESLTPRLHWNNTADDVYYYEIQVSKDPNFETDPQRATAAVTWELVNVCAQPAPYLFYQVRSAYSLDANQTYYWRVRPRIQGDGTPVAWPPAWNFQTGGGVLKSAEAQSAEKPLLSQAVAEMDSLPKRLEPEKMKATLSPEGVIFEARQLKKQNRFDRRHGNTT